MWQSLKTKPFFFLLALSGRIKNGEWYYQMYKCATQVKLNGYAKAGSPKTFLFPFKFFMRKIAAG
jgi:hypothetical protein